MATDSGAPVPAPAPPAAELRRSVDLIEQRIREIRATQSAIRTQTTLAVIVILILVGAFTLATYKVMRENLSQEKVEAALRLRGNQIIDQMTPRFAAALRDVQPVYMDLAKQRLEKVAPEIQQSFVKEATKLPSDVQAELDGDLQASVARVESRLREDLKTHFPKLNDEQLKALGGRMEDELRQEGQGLADHMNGLLRQEMDRLLTSLDAFPVPDVSRAEADDVQKLFLHNLLMLVDHELLVAGTDEALRNPEIEVLPAAGDGGGLPAAFSGALSREGAAEQAASVRQERRPASAIRGPATQPAGPTARPAAGSRQR